MLSCAWHDIKRELGMEIIEEHTMMEYSKVSKKCEKCGHGEAIYYTRQVIRENSVVTDEVLEIQVFNCKLTIVM
ncbi:hypothetical protein AAZX31_06G201100 [Glycine max]